ncbi:MAG: hypothetical protein ACYTE8_06565 [Planctomycetota bacterium]|jgi:hypothetical protein
MTTLGREIQRLKKKIKVKSDLHISDETPDSKLTLKFNEILIQIIRPRDQSDRTCFRKIGIWLNEGCQKGKFTKETYNEVIEYAKEAAAPESRNPAAVFLTLLKKKMDYRP